MNVFSLSDKVESVGLVDPDSRLAAACGTDISFSINDMLLRLVQDCDVKGETSMASDRNESCLNSGDSRNRNDRSYSDSNDSTGKK